MAHRARSGMVAELVERLDRPAAIVWADDDVEWHTGRRAWEAADGSATHHLVVQDDAIVCGDLVAGVEHWLARLPAGAAMSLYFGRTSPFPRQTGHVAALADEAGASWLVLDRLYWGVAAVLPTPYIGPMLAWPRGSRFGMYDQRVSAWLVDHDVPVYHPWPSLVDHRDAPSLLPGHGIRPGRVAHRFAGENVSALDLDLSGPVLDVGPLARVRPRRPTPCGRADR